MDLWYDKLINVEYGPYGLSKNNKPYFVAITGTTFDINVISDVVINETIKGNIALPLFLPAQDKRGLSDLDLQAIEATNQKKIDICNKLIVIAIDGLVGPRTRAQAEYAKKAGKPIETIYFLSIKNEK